MDTFKIISLTPAEHLAPLLKWMEARQIPYNVELNTKRVVHSEGNNSRSNREFVLKLLDTKSPLTASAIGDAFEAAGKMRSSSHGATYALKKDGLIKHTKQGYIKGGK